MKFLLTFLFIFLGLFPLYSQYDLDSLKQSLEQADRTTDKVDLMNAIAYQLAVLTPDKAISYLNQAKALAKQGDYEYGIASTKYVMGKVFTFRNRYDSAITLLREALPFMQQQQKQQDIINIYNTMARCLGRMGKLDSSNLFYTKGLELATHPYDKSISLIGLGYNYTTMGALDIASKHLLDAIQLIDNTKHYDNLSIAYLNLGNIHYKKEEIDIAIQHYQESLKNAEKSNFYPVQTRCYSNLGALLVARDSDYDAAFKYYFKAVKIQEEQGDNLGLAASYRNIARTFIIKKDFAQGEKYLLKSVAIYEELQNPKGLIRINKLISSFYWETDRLGEAVKYIDRSVNLAKEFKMTHEMLKSLEVKYHILADKEDYKQAYRTIVQYEDIEDSIFTETKSRQIHELEAKYEASQKEAEIRTLSQQATIQELELNRRNQWLLIIGFSSILLIALFFIYYYRSQQNQLQAKATTAEIEQRFLRSQLNPHFIFNALDSIQNYMLDHDAPKASLYMSKFAKLMRQVLENSREKFISLTEEVKMLENYMELQKLQANTDFSYEIELDEQIDEEDFAIPPMFVQPFVENAIEHGVIQGKGLIHVHFHLENDLVNITVTDNGIGLSESRQIQHQQAKTHKSLATSIIKERIESYNEKLKTNIELLVSEMVSDNQQIVGTQVLLKVPYQLS